MVSDKIYQSGSSLEHFSIAVHASQHHGSTIEASRKVAAIIAIGVLASINTLLMMRGYVSRAVVSYSM